MLSGAKMDDEHRGPLEFPQSSNLELSKSGTFKECCQVICITSNVRAKLLQAKGTCTGSESAAQTAVCLEPGDSRFPASRLLQNVCAVTGPPQLVALPMVVYVSYLPSSVSGSVIHCSPSIHKGRPWCLLPFSLSFVLSPPSVLPDRHS